MSCSVIQPTLQALFPLSSTLTITRSLNASLTPGGEDALKQASLAYGNGLVYAQLWYDGVEQFFCKANGCTQTVSSASGSSVNGSNWNCPSLVCTCRNGTDFCGGQGVVSGFIPLLTLGIFKRSISTDQRFDRLAHDRLSFRWDMQFPAVVLERAVWLKRSPIIIVLIR